MHDRRYVTRDRVVVTCLCLFVVGIALSMRLYPGGTWWNLARERHAFCENFLCDLLHDPALNNKPNWLGALAAKVSMLLFIFGLGVLWTMTERWVSDTRLARLVCALGVLGTFPLALVPLTPSNHHARLHTLAVLVGGLPSLMAFLLFGAALWRSGRVPALLRVLSLLLGVLVLVCLALYACGAIGACPAATTLPALERFAVVLIVLWVALLLRQPRAGGGANGQL
jgi:hypothetical protein